EPARHPRPRLARAARGDGAGRRGHRRDPTAGAGHVRDDVRRQGDRPRGAAGGPPRAGRGDRRGRQAVRDHQPRDRAQRGDRPRRGGVPLDPRGLRRRRAQRAGGGARDERAGGADRGRRERAARPLPAARDRPPARAPVHRLPEHPQEARGQAAVGARARQVPHGDPQARPGRDRGAPQRRGAV
ncbi:MAG: Peptide deformylase, partial [uncultured Gemmatimonadaceae bacterium]